MKSSTKWTIWIVIILAVILIFWSSTSNAEPSIYNEFAQCLTESGTKMYGAYWCPHCANQKESFGNSFEFVNYIECDPRGDNANPSACEAENIEGYPTWIFADGERRSGEIPLAELAFRSGCELPE